MTNQEAIDILKLWKDNCKKVLVDSVYIDAMGIAIKALEKQIPKKPEDVRLCSSPGRYFGCYIGGCPTCGRGNNSRIRWCGACGQHLDWSETDAED